jgi:hypothetical protein
MNRDPTDSSHIEQPTPEGEKQSEPTAEEMVYRKILGDKLGKCVYDTLKPAALSENVPTGWVLCEEGRFKGLGPVYWKALPVTPFGSRTEIVYTNAPESFERTWTLLQGIQVGIEAMKVRPRNQVRDAEIVRLRDQEKLTWGQVLRKIKTNSEWAKNERGCPLSLDAVKQAYKRAKSDDSSIDQS